jgi:dihydroorotase
MQMIIKNGHVIDPGNMNAMADIYVDDGKIVGIEPLESPKERSVRGKKPAVGKSVSAQDRKSALIIDASGLIVAPGFIDMHVHLREPGEEYKETIASGIRAAAAGGFTSICCMPNTRPVNDNAQVTEYIIQTAARCRSVHVFPVAAISRGLSGKEMCEYGELRDAGAVALSDDGKPVVDSLLMRRALEYAAGVGLRVISHCEDPSLSIGVMNEGGTATRAGLAGIPNAAESIMVMRDIAISELTGIPVHIAHVSAKESVCAIRDAKARGVKVTAETAPHYFTLTDDALIDYDTNAKMNPPLRSAADREAIRNALSDGTIDAIATDHAPHSILEKEVEFDMAANGIIGLETSVGLSLMLVNDGVLSMETLIEKLSKNPSRILGLKTGIVAGNAADLTIIDPHQAYRYHSREGFSMSKNTPFDGWEFPGRVLYTIVNGEIVFQA